MQRLIIVYSQDNGDGRNEYVVEPMVAESKDIAVEAIKNAIDSHVKMRNDNENLKKALMIKRTELIEQAYSRIHSEPLPIPKNKHFAGRNFEMEKSVFHEPEVKENIEQIKKLNVDDSKSFSYGGVKLMLEDCVCFDYKNNICLPGYPTIQTVDEFFAHLE